MKHLVFLLLVFVSMSVSAQKAKEPNIEENVKNTTLFSRTFAEPYRCNFSPAVKFSKLKAFMKQKSSEYCFGDYKEDGKKVLSLEFVPVQNYDQYVYEYLLLNGLKRSDIPYTALSKEGEALVHFVHSYDNKIWGFGRFKVKWNGEIKNGMIHGKGVGLAVFEKPYIHGEDLFEGPRKYWIVFQGEFHNGYLVKNYKAATHQLVMSSIDRRTLYLMRSGKRDWVYRTSLCHSNFSLLVLDDDYALYKRDDNGSLFLVDDKGTVNGISVSSWIQRLMQKAESGNADAIYNLSYMYVTGNGMTKDHTKGAQLLQQAAEKGHINAMVSYGMILESGLGVQQNYSKAAEWYKKALDKDPNNSNAKKFLAAVQQKMDDERQKIADEKAKPDKDAKLIQEMFQEAKSYNISGDASKFDLRDKFLNEFISTCSKNPKYDKYKVLAKAKKLSSFCRVVKALYHWSDAPTNWYYEEKMLGLVRYPVWNERPTQMVIEAIDGALAICQKMTKDPDFGPFFTKSIPLLKEKRIKVNNNLSKERREYNAVVAENDARWESRNHEVDTDRHKSPSGELEFHTLLPADGYHYENDGELRSKSGSDYCTYNVHFDRNKKIDYYYIKSCSSKVRDYLKGKTKFKTGSELTSAFMNAIR